MAEPPTITTPDSGSPGDAVSRTRTYGVWQHIWSATLKRKDRKYDLGRYAREVLATEDTRRSVLGFTLCGSIMRLWEFDRVGGIASSLFDINKGGL